ncbi:hypothetical protein, partial [Heliomicrobium gestii]|uniref:hypothetical protein n=1 Tax=Heliomicrobium gestii TaxID=2699 RepID=UPI00195E0958
SNSPQKFVDKLESSSSFTIVRTTVVTDLRSSAAVRFRLAPSATNCGIDWFRTLLIRNCSIFKDQRHRLPATFINIITILSQLQEIFLL